MNFLITSKPLLYLCHVNLMACELTNLESCYVACHHHVVVRTTFNNDLRLIGGRTGFFSGLIVHSIFQLPPICCDLKRNNDTKQSPTLYLLDFWALFLRFSMNTLPFCLTCMQNNGSVRNIWMYNERQVWHEFCNYIWKDMMFVSVYHYTHTIL